jgi:hypothetical protein
VGSTPHQGSFRKLFEEAFECKECKYFIIIPLFLTAGYSFASFAQENARPADFHFMKQSRSIKIEVFSTLHLKNLGQVLKTNQKKGTRENFPGSVSLVTFFADQRK